MYTWRATPAKSAGGHQLRQPFQHASIMSLTYGLKTARDLLAKLERDADLLQSEVSSDRFFNFVVTAYSLADWVQADPSVRQAA